MPSSVVQTKQTHICNLIEKQISSRVGFNYYKAKKLFCHNMLIVVQIFKNKLKIKYKESIIYLW